MGWRCLLGHEWKIKTSKEQHLFENDESKRPSIVRTLVLWQCKKCYALKVQKLNGGFQDIKDDDRDDDPPPSPRSKLTPDEYFSLITKD